MLVAVIWLSGILAAFAISVAVTVRSHALYERNVVSEVLAKGIADGLARLTALRVSSRADALSQDGEWRSCRWFEEADVWISVQDNSGLVDLNTASRKLMTALIRGLGIGSVQAEAIVSEMRDYRDADFVTDQGGLEPSSYPGQIFGPKNAGFEAVEELDQLPGMTPELFRRLRRLTTVSNLQTGVDFGTAPADLLRILGLDRTSVAGLPFSSPRTSETISVTVAVQLGNASRFVRRSDVERTGDARRPFVIMVWEQGEWPADLPNVSSLDCATGKAGR